MFRLVWIGFGLGRRKRGKERLGVGNDVIEVYWCIGCGFGVGSGEDEAPIPGASCLLSGA